MLVKEFMIRDITSVMEDTSIEYLIKILYRHRRYTLPIVNENNSIIGTISVEDVLNASLPHYFKSMQNTAFLPDINQFSTKLKEIRDYKITEFMIKDPITVTEEDTITRVADILIKSDLKTIFVVKNNRLSGYINRIDLISSILKE